MRVPYQQLKQHVAAGPSGMRNEYLRCLVGEYAPASGPAAVRAMSEVASMYLQGRLPGWFNRLFASARLVAPVKKLGEGRAPDVRPVAVGEAERRAAERAVVDNMKEAYVSVLAPSLLGVAIPAGDYVLIHGVRLIAEKLGPRAVIVHTDLRNAYNEACRRTIIQRHIDCSPLHPVIPALLASLSTDSYLVVDARSAPLRSEDGVQHGAPLATTSFCVAIHPEVQQCDTTLEVNDGAARFNADDGFLVGLPEHVWPALHAFRTSIKASVGLEVRFDTMQAYIVDMEAARREAPADIEWPELDGHHGIAVLNVPLGSPEYVHAYMRGKAEELREEVDASLSKLLSAKPSRRYTHALHHHAWALLKHCMQHKAGYWLRNCLPSEVEAFAEAVDATILAAVERVLGVSFDPSMYGTDTNPVVTDFLAELLHDPDPMAAEVATLSEDAVAMARSRLHLPTRLKGAGIRRMATVRDAAFICCMNAILPRSLTRNSGTNTPTPGFFDPQLGSVLGRGSFNATSSARQYDHFLNDAHGSDSYAAEMREAWGRLQAATAGHLGDEDARQMEREVAASGPQKELTAFLDQANNSRLRNEVCALPATCRERILFNQLDAASGMWTPGHWYRSPASTDDMGRGGALAAAQLSDFELQRQQRIKENKARLAALGVAESHTALKQSLVVVKAPKVPRKRKERVEAEPAERRKSLRLKGGAPEYKQLADEEIFEAEESGLIKLPVLSAEDAEAQHERLEAIRTSTNQSRSTVYDKALGITCHFCRQKTLCKEADCPRCSARDPEAECLGKSECQKCHSATGQFCRACLRLRYGLDLDEVKKQEAAGTWVCPHCYEADHPEEGWICNSSICMTRRGLKPTGIAIHKARELGFESVAHLVQAQLAKHRKDK
eukprot:jgi/Tetstr1/422170/TSEL_013023.t1